jgi:hypothetical protein
VVCHPVLELELDLLVLEAVYKPQTVTVTHRRPNRVPLISRAILWQFEFEDEIEDEP